ncbi:MAG TPA: DUF6298 domain-containing protein [Chthonomonadales bacterium]|nr:DUF6298 domain-containing protein [Chthonomonadales bacterium]
MAPPPGPLRTHPANPRYFAEPSGRPVYLAGSHTWAVMQDMWLEGAPRRNTDYAGFLQMLEDHGHNFLRFWQWMHPKRAAWNQTPTLFCPQPFERTGPGEARDGLPRFDLSRPNPAYYARLRERVEQAGERGIYVSVMLFEAWTVKWPTPETDPWPLHPMHPDNNVNGIEDDPRVPEHGWAWNLFSLACPQLLRWQEAYVRQVVEALNDLDHVLYEVCNEVPHRGEALAWQDHMAAFVHDLERGLTKQHPVGITAEGGDQDNSELFATCADWLSPSNGRLFEYRYNPPAADGRKVILTDTDHLWGHGCEVAWIWKSFTRGMNVLFMDPWERIPGELDWWRDGDVSRNQRHYWAWDDVRRNLGYTRRVAERMDLARCTPRGELCTSTYCLADPGREYACYFPTGGPEGLDLWNAAGEFCVEWLDPATGRTTRGGAILGGTRHALQAPFAGPAVLIVRRV